MAKTTPDAAEIAKLERIYTGDETLRLYKNDVSISAATVIGDFTEVDFGGYAAKALDVGNYTFETDGDDGKVSQPSAQTTFTGTGNAGGETIYGWYLTNDAGDELLDCEAFSPSQTPADGAWEIVVNWLDKLKSETNN
jgi:hypothetical protein